MDFHLPPAAVAILQTSYKDSIFQCGLSHTQRRKLWKKYKRKKRRIIDHFAVASLQAATSCDSDSEDIESDLPRGPLTNSVVIRYLRQKYFEARSQCVKRGILNNVPLPTDHDQNAAPLNSVDCQSTETIETAFDVEKIEESGTRSKNETREINDLLAQLDDEVERWHNPSPPPNYKEPVDDAIIATGLPETSLRNGLDQLEVEDNRPLCSFFSKTGACRFGNQCSKRHYEIDDSDTLLFPNMFKTFLFDLEDRLKIAGDTHDLSLEHSDQDLYDEFKEFYDDARPEFQGIGEISNMFVCNNRCHHLRGNVYVQYRSKDDAKRCLEKMCGRYYGGKPLLSKYVNISSWAETICGIDNRGGKCVRGGQCNYLHVFHIPNSHIHHYSRHNETSRSRHRSSRDRSYEINRRKCDIRSSDRSSTGRLKRKKRHKRSRSRSHSPFPRQSDKSPLSDASLHAKRSSNVQSPKDQFRKASKKNSKDKEKMKKSKKKKKHKKSRD